MMFILSEKDLSGYFCRDITLYCASLSFYFPSDITMVKLRKIDGNTFRAFYNICHSLGNY